MYLLEKTMFSFSLKFFVTLTFGIILLANDLKAEPANTSATANPTTIKPKNNKRRQTRGIASVNESVRAHEQALERARTSLSQANLQKRRAEARVDMFRRRVERYLDPVVVEFLIDTHIEGAQTCNRYKSYANGCLRSPQANSEQVAVNPSCSELLDVPEILATKWNDRVGGRGNYCVGNSRQNAGSVSPELCADENLHVQTSRRSINSTECSRALTEYRAARIELANIVDREESLEDQIREREIAIEDAIEEQRINDMREED
jgi:hypothetical protein